MQVAQRFLPYAQALRSHARSIGASFKVVSGYRSPELQARMRDAWFRAAPPPERLRLSDILSPRTAQRRVGSTRALSALGWRFTSEFGWLYKPALSSYHSSGDAIDISSDKLTELGTFARSIGMRWSPTDPVHFDRPPGGVRP